MPEVVLDVGTLSRARQLADALLRQMRHGGGARRSAAARFMRHAFADKASSYASQLALEEARPDEAVVFATGLHGHVLQASRSLHANYVVQRMLVLLPPSVTGFIPRELRRSGAEVARHHFGCRILCRLLEHGSFSEQGSLAPLVEEILADCLPLCKHTFGNYVIRHCLQFGLPAHQRWVSGVLLTDVYDVARHRYGSRVVQAVLQQGPPEERLTVAWALVADQAQLVALATCLSGRFVVQALLSMDCEPASQAMQMLRDNVARLRSSPHGQRLLEALLPPSLPLQPPPKARAPAATTIWM